MGDLVNYAVKPIPSNQGKAFIIQHHYSHGSHNGPTCYGLFDPAEKLVGVLAFATPCSENVRASVWGKGTENSVTELHRLVILDTTPKNAESFMISRCLKLLKRSRPHINGVLSFADHSEGHVGTIYQACNAVYTGTTGSSTFYLDKTNRLRHPRQCGTNITVKDAIQRGWTPVKRAGKYRYLFILHNSKWHKRRLMENLLLKPQAYPKP